MLFLATSLTFDIKQIVWYDFEICIIFSPDDVRIAASHVYVPSRQQIDYTMVRVVGAAHLFHQTATYALQAFDQAMQQIQLGMIVHNMVVFCATTSRVW